jgi:hypothetical protein
MAETESFNAQGSILYIGTNADPIVWTAIGDVRSATGPSGSRTVIDATHLTSGAKEKRVGLADEGQFTFETAFAPGNAGHIALHAAKRDPNPRPFRLVLADSDVVADRTVGRWKGFVLGLPVTIGVDALTTLPVTIEITDRFWWSLEPGFDAAFADEPVT